MAEDVGNSNIIEFGPGWGNPAIGIPVTTPDQTKDYIYTGPGRLTPGIPQLLPQEIDDVTESFGVKVYEYMLTDPAVYSSYLALKLSIIAGPIRVKPAVRPKGYRDGKKYSPDAGAKLSPQESMSIEVAEFCERELKRLKRSFKSTLLQLLDMMAFGHKLAEKTREEVTAGPDKGKLGLKSIKVKPGWAWKFIVNGTMEPVGILTYVPPDILGRYQGTTEATALTGGYFIVPVDKFVLASWLPKDNDPRGTSALRAAYDWWNLKRQCMPFYYQHLRRFGSPSLDVEMAPGDVAERQPLDPTTGLEIPNVPPVSPIQRMTQALIAFQNNSVIVRPAGSKLNVIEPKSNGDAFLQGFDLFDRAICLAIGLQTRATLEAKHGSKADSETAQDNRGLVTAYAREECGELVSRSVFYDSVLLNFGEDIAEEFTPELIVGTTEQQDKATMLSAASSAGYSFGPSQAVELDVMLDVPERDEEADMKAAQDAMQMQADLQAQSSNAGGPDKAQPPQTGGRTGGKGASGQDTTKK